MRLIFQILVVFVFSSSVLQSKDDKMKERVYGVTIDNINNIDEITESLGLLSVKPTSRIVFDGQKPADYYNEAVLKIHDVSFIMGEILDSYWFKNYSVSQYNDRVREYLDAFGTKVYIWEIVNEINGEWLGNPDTVIKKMTDAFRIVNGEGKNTAVTFYYNSECYGKPENEMFRWINENVPQYMKDSLNYVFVSYYEDDCNDIQPDWQKVFDSLHVIFPNSKLGIGECGTKIKTKKELYIERYYNMNISTPNFVGGYFWWYYKQDCVPYTKRLWNVLNSIFEKEK
jgi:hypothetical protein